MDEMTSLDRALSVLGPLEARIMGEIWTGAVPGRFMVRDVRARMPELAHTTIMTMLNRLADKGLLTAERMGQRRATHYRVHWTPDAFLAESGRRGTEDFVRRYGDAALVAFAARLDALTPEQRERLRQMGSRAS
jgi:predicted transcriptional regulator